ncbi:MAG: hypothetical protein P8018_00890 [Acidobacteriota bacterium]
MGKRIVLQLMTFLFAAGVFGLAMQAAGTSVTETTRDFTVTLKVLPPESFSGPKAEMVHDGGAKPLFLKGKHPPNHHLVVFVKKDGKPVEKAKVQIKYRPADDAKAAWVEVPVVKMHVAGKGASTTHFGNNVNIPYGFYEVDIVINGGPPAVFKLTI